MTASETRRRTANPAASPTPEAIREWRESAGLTHRAAAERIYCAERSWQDWESGARRMHPAFADLWQRKRPR